MISYIFTITLNPNGTGRIVTNRNHGTCHPDGGGLVSLSISVWGETFDLSGAQGLSFDLSTIPSAGLAGQVRGRSKVLVFNPLGWYRVDPNPGAPGPPARATGGQYSVSSQLDRRSDISGGQHGGTPNTRLM